MSYYYPQPSFVPMPMLQPGMDSRSVPNPQVMSHSFPTYKEFVASNNYNHNDWKRNRMNKQVPYPHRQVPIPAYALPPPRLQPPTYQNNEKIISKSEQYKSDETDTAEKWDDRRTISPIPITNRLFELQTPPRLPTTINKPIAQMQNPWNHPMKRSAMMGVPPTMTHPIYYPNPSVQAMRNRRETGQPPLYQRHPNPAPAAAAVVYPPLEIVSYQPIMPLAHYRTSPYPQFMQQPIQHSKYAFQPVAPPMMPPPYQQQDFQRSPAKMKSLYPEEYQKQPFNMQQKIAQTTHWNAADMKLNFGF